MNGTNQETTELLHEGQIENTEHEVQAEPTDLSEALKMYREQNSRMVDEPMEAEQAIGSEQPGNAEPEGEAASASGQIEMPMEQSSYGEAGGSAALEPGVDYGSYRNDLTDSINKQAIDETRKLFNEQGIEKLSVRQLAKRDESTGEIVFENPDNPRRPFTSRSEAQQWCDSFNRDVDEEFKRTAMEKRSQLLEQYKPAMQMIDFAAKFSKFDKLKQEVIDEIIAPYAITSNNQVVGYRCDLDKAAEQADKLIAKLGNGMLRESTPKAKPNGSGPATDISGSGTPSSEIEAEPKNLSEALAMYNKSKRKK